MNYEELYINLKGKEPTYEEKLHFERLVRLLNTTPNDAMFSILLVLDYYRALYETIPKQITESAISTLTDFELTAKAKVDHSLTEAKAELAKYVEETMRKLATKPASDQKWKWFFYAMCVAMFFMLPVGYFMYDLGSSAGFEDGYDYAFSKALRYDKWAYSEEGLQAYKLATSGDLNRILKCSGEGWKVIKGTCYPFAQKNGNLQGWKLPNTTH